MPCFLGFSALRPLIWLPFPPRPAKGQNCEGFPRGGSLGLGSKRHLASPGLLWGLPRFGLLSPAMTASSELSRWPWVAGTPGDDPSCCVSHSVLFGNCSIAAPATPQRTPRRLPDCEPPAGMGWEPWIAIRGRVRVSLESVDLHLQTEFRLL